MNKRVSVALIILSLAVLFTMTTAVDAAEQRSFVIANSKDWKEIYVASVYAGVNDADYFFFFSDLADTQLKTKMIAKDDMVTVFESKENPVVKDYDSRLEVNGYEFVATNKYNSLSDLQETVYEKIDPEGFVVFGTDYGTEPVVTLPFLIKNKYSPFFYTEESAEYINQQAEEKRAIFAGRIPVRDADLANKEAFLGGPIDTTLNLTDYVISEVPHDWGVMTRVDQIDFQSLLSERPVFLHFGTPYLDELSQLTRDSGIERFEVIGGDMVGIAEDIESAAGEDFKFMLKYGRKITNYRSADGDSILDIDSLELPRPVEHLKISNVTYYPNLNTLGVTYYNDGNVDQKFYSNLEYGGNSFSDENPHFIPAQHNLTYTYEFNNTELSEDSDMITITSRHGRQVPLTLNIEENGSEIIEKTVYKNSLDENPRLLLKDVTLNPENGDITIKLHNNASQQLIYFGELMINDSEIQKASKNSLVDSGAEDEIVLEFPYTSNDELLNKTADIVLRYGTEDTILSTSETFTIKPVEKSSNIPRAGVIALVVVAVVLILLWLLISGRKKKPSEEGKHANKSKKTTAKKKTQGKGKKKSSSKRKTSKKK